MKTEILSGECLTFHSAFTLKHMKTCKMLSMKCQSFHAQGCLPKLATKRRMFNILFTFILKLMNTCEMLSMTHPLISISSCSRMQKNIMQNSQEYFEDVRLKD